MFTVYPLEKKVVDLCWTSPSPTVIARSAATGVELRCPALGSSGPGWLLGPACLLPVMSPPFSARSRSLTSALATSHNNHHEVTGSHPNSATDTLLPVATAPLASDSPTRAVTFFSLCLPPYPQSIISITPLPIPRPVAFSFAANLKRI